MSTYLVFIREATLDPAELAVYTRQAPGTLAGQPVKVLAFFGGHEVLEGDGIEGMVILEFPDPEAARRWYESPAYRAAREHRFKGAKYRVLLTEGVETPR